MIIKISKADLMKGKVLPPNWYRVSIVGADVRHPKQGQDSLNYCYTFRFDTVDGYELEHIFNTKALGFMAPFIAAVRNTNLAEIAASMNNETLEFDNEEPLGKVIQVKVTNEPWEGRLTNKIKDFLPANATVPF